MTDKVLSGCWVDEGSWNRLWEPRSCERQNDVLDKSTNSGAWLPGFNSDFYRFPTLDKLLNLSMPQFPLLCDILVPLLLIALLWGLNKWIYVKDYRTMTYREHRVLYPFISPAPIPEPYAKKVSNPVVMTVESSTLFQGKKGTIVALKNHHL